MAFISNMQYLKELEDLRSQLSCTRATAEASAESAQSAHFQCLSLLKELEEKNSSLKENEIRVKNLGEQLDHMQKDLKARELSQQQLKEEVLRVEKEIMQVVTKAGVDKDGELRKILDEISPKNLEKMNKLLDSKDGEIARLRDEIRFLSSHWKHKTKELESQVITCTLCCMIAEQYYYLFFDNFLLTHFYFSFSTQLEKQRRADQELKKKVLKLEFCLQEARSQLRKVQRVIHYRSF